MPPRGNKEQNQLSKMSRGIEKQKPIEIHHMVHFYGTLGMEAGSEANSDLN